MLYEISSGEISVKISDVGAEIKSVVCRGKERAWQNENGSWSRTSPVLFPVCGRTSVKINGKDHGMPFHGFARDSVFSCERVSDEEVSFTLESGKETLAVYPFEFELKITYKVEKNSLRITNEVSNNGKTTMPFAIGRHDSFSFDAPVGEHKLVFSSDEKFLSQNTDEIGRVVDSYVDFGKGREFLLPEDFLSDGRTVIFSGINSDSVLLKTVDNRPIAELFLGGVKNLLIWRPNGAMMACLELWSALPDSPEETDFDLYHKSRLFFLGSGEKKIVDLVIKYY